jgi:putative sporulation protein YtxC
LLKGVITLILLSVGHSKNSRDIYDKFKELCVFLKEKSINVAIVESDIGTMHYIKCVLRDTEKDINAFEGVRDLFYTYCSNIIYDFISHEYEVELIEKLIKQNYNYLDSADLQQIKDRCTGLIMGTGMFTTQGLLYSINYRNSILQKIDDYLQESNELILDGFITFRLRGISDDLNNIIDKVAEDYVLEKEYSEFIKLLKYFVDIQESKYELVNIYIDEIGNYLVKDEHSTDITEELFEDFNLENAKGEVSKDDLLISALITSAPQKILIHGIENVKCQESIDTLKSIFVEKLTFCTGCETCRSFIQVRGR